LAHAVNATFAELNKDIPRAEIVADLTAAVLCEMQQISGYQAQTYDYVRHYCQDKDDKAVIKAVMGALTTLKKSLPSSWTQQHSLAQTNSLLRLYFFALN
jgi:hypothetical protein